MATLKFISIVGLRTATQSGMSVCVDLIGIFKFNSNNIFFLNFFALNIYLLNFNSIQFSFVIFLWSFLLVFLHMIPFFDTWHGISLWLSLRCQSVGEAFRQLTEKLFKRFVDSQSITYKQFRIVATTKQCKSNWRLTCSLSSYVCPDILLAAVV